MHHKEDGPVPESTPWTRSMSENLLIQLSALSDDRLLAEVKECAHNERRSTAELVAHLAVLDERGLYRRQGCASLFTYCTQVLLLSNDAAYNRIQAARAARKFPIILYMLASGAVNLTTIKRLAPHLTTENHL